MTDTPTRCPECHHDINWHGYEFDFDRYMCGGTYGDCNCDLSPSDIARALLTAEPTEAMLDAASEALESELADVGLTWTAARHAARAAIRAAREARA